MKFVDGHEVEWSQTGITPEYAMLELLHSFMNCLYDDSEADEEMKKAREEHNEVVGIQYMHCDTYGVDTESDKILEEEDRCRHT